MDKNWESGVKEIQCPIHATSGEIVGFILKDKTRLSRQQALLEARQGKLIGINLYPSFVQEVVKQDSKKPLLKRILQVFKGNDS